MSGLCFFLIVHLCHCILYPHLGISAASKAQLHLGPSSLHSAPFLASPELPESRQVQSCPQDICPCCSPHSSEIPMDFPSYLLVSMQRPLLRRPSCTILFKTANHPHIPCFLFILLPKRAVQPLITSCPPPPLYIGLLSTASLGLDHSRDLINKNELLVTSKDSI